MQAGEISGEQRSWKGIGKVCSCIAFCMSLDSRGIRGLTNRTHRYGTREGGLKEKITRELFLLVFNVLWKRKRHQEKGGDQQKGW